MYNIVYACNDAYAKLAGISLISLLKNNSAHDFRVFVMDDKIAPENREKLVSIKDRFSNLSDLIFVECDSLISDIKNYMHGYENSVDTEIEAGYTIYARLFFEQFIPSDVDRILYIDCDTLVNGDISPLFSFDMDGKAIAMSFDCTNDKYRKYLKLPEGFQYFNSGVLIINTQEWKKHNCLKLILDEVHKGISYPFPDQDLLNICLQGRIAKYSFRYNFCSAFYLYGSAGAISFIFGRKNFLFYKDDYASSIKNPVILHFNGNTFTRPWFKNSVHPMKKLYDSYYFDSPWKDEEQKSFEMNRIYKLQYFLYKYTPRFFFYFCSRILQDIFYKIYYKI